MFRLTRTFILLLVLALTACSGVGAPAGAPASPAVVVSEVTATEQATPTTPPTLAPTATAVPPTDVPTATAVPPTTTPTPEPPTATPTPGPGSLLFAADFNHLTDWTEFAVPESSRFTFEARDDRLRVEVDDDGVTAYLTYNTDLGYADVQMDADVETLDGPNRNNVSLLCRVNEKGWYEFSMYSSGLWEIWKYAGERYTSLASGGSTAIHMQKAKNHLTAVCEGKTLTWYINDVKVGSAVDNEFAEGRVGLSVSTFNIPGVVVEFSTFEVTLPDPANPPGLAVAPTLPPSTGGGSGGVPSLPTVPVPGGTLGDFQLQENTLTFILLYESVASPDCQTRQMVNTEVTGITQDFRFEGTTLVAGAWTERWTIDSCGVVTAYRVSYTADASGGVLFSVNKG